MLRSGIAAEAVDLHQRSGEGFLSQFAGLVAIAVGLVASAFALAFALAGAGPARAADAPSQSQILWMPPCRPQGREVRSPPKIAHFAAIKGKIGTSARLPSRDVSFRSR